MTRSTRLPAHDFLPAFARKFLAVAVAAASGFISFAPRASAHDGEHDYAPKPMALADLHRTTVMPDRVVLTWCGDPASSQAVTWRTSTTVTRALAQIAVASDGPQGGARDQAATTVRFDSNLGSAHYHAVEFTDLAPNTLYAYRVGDGINAIKIERVQQIDVPDLWAVRRHGDVLNRSGEWEWEPMPSSRDDEFLVRCRFSTHTEAIAAAMSKPPVQHQEQQP